MHHPPGLRGAEYFTGVEVGRLQRVHIRQNIHRLIGHDFPLLKRKRPRPGVGRGLGGQLLLFREKAMISDW